MFATNLICILFCKIFINIKKQGLKILSCGSGIESQDKQKRSKALPLGESMTSEAHPIALGVGG
jgi:hypothetical protein